MENDQANDEELDETIRSAQEAARQQMQAAIAERQAVAQEMAESAKSEPGAPEPGFVEQQAGQFTLPEVSSPSNPDLTPPRSVGLNRIAPIPDKAVLQAKAGPATTPPKPHSREGFAARRRVGNEMRHAAEMESGVAPEVRETFGGMDRSDMEAAMFPHHARQPEEAGRRIAGHHAATNDVMSAVIEHFGSQDQMLVHHERTIRHMTQALQRNRY